MAPRPWLQSSIEESEPEEQRATLMKMGLLQSSIEESELYKLGDNADKLTVTIVHRGI